MAVIPAAWRASSSATYWVVTAVPRGLTSEASAAKSAALSHQVDEDIDAVRVRLSHRVW